jgi:2-dehydro-3-deoxyphosphogluconate aldolase / (4S)-4-hydroxy-2-oxoglutarate aldolase
VGLGEKAPPAGHEALARLANAKVVPVLRAGSAEQAVGAVDCLRSAGVAAVEVTFTTPDASRALREARARHGEDLLVGAGTIRTTGELESALEAGADFLVTPHVDEELLRAMLARGRLSLPGTFTPSEVALALEAGAQAVKIFPASTGGVAHLRALLGPFPELRAIPTGGIAAGDVANWLAAGAVAVGAGSDLCPPELMQPGREDELVARAREWLRTALGGA